MSNDIKSLILFIIYGYLTSWIDCFSPIRASENDGEMIKIWNILKTINLTISRIVEFSLKKFMLHQDYFEANMDEFQQGSAVNDTAE
ncbi:hypothetical protein A3Q56_00116 [Intoshia linei]|uniref:Bestrophin homolog n=1 Tax=Intoshia linei TaxID=1819745 RepID=A0A177BEX1_9BILA|nr:hypothetical protein A3Q56_00116 [Intoshia linei]